MEHHEWGWMVVVYLFLGGLGAGALVLSGGAVLTRRGCYDPIARFGAVVAPILVAAGTGLLVFDLGQPLRSWKLFAHLNPVSPMSVGAWLLTIFLIVAAVHLALQLPPAWLEAAAARSRSLRSALLRLAAWNRLAPAPERGASGDRTHHPDSPRSVSNLRTVVAALGVPLGLSVGIYTGVLLGAIPARPFWNTPMVAQLFLFSALSSASALVLLGVGPFLRGAVPPQARRALLRVDLVFICLELFIIIPYVIHGELSVRSARLALDLILGGPYTWPFWGGVVVLGILIPLVLEAADLLGAVRGLPKPLANALHVAAPVLVLVGGYLLRWVFVHAGQDSVFI